MCSPWRYREVVTPTFLSPEETTERQPSPETLEARQAQRTPHAEQFSQGSFSWSMRRQRRIRGLGVTDPMSAPTVRPTTPRGSIGLVREKQASDASKALQHELAKVIQRRVSLAKKWGADTGLIREAKVQQGGLFDNQTKQRVEMFAMN